MDFTHVYKSGRFPYGKKEEDHASDEKEIISNLRKENTEKYK